MKVQLIQPTLGQYLANSRTGSYPPLGLVSIATYLRQECPSIQVDILDGEMLSHEEITARIDADIVGINANTVTYPQAIRVAEIAKDRGATVVLGGVYASAIPERILAKRSHLIDSLVVGYGEEPMVDIVRGRRDKVIVNHEVPFDRVPYPDRSLIPLEDYIGVFRQSHPTWDYRATNIFTSVGCKWRQTTGGCIFCSRSSAARTAQRHPDAIWREIRELVEEHGVDYVVDFSDTILQDLEWLQTLVEAKPADLNPAWHVFGRIDEITRPGLALLRRLPCKHVFVGIESGDQTIYAAARKGGGSPRDSLQMAANLSEFGIGLTPSYVIGLPGETHESLQRTYEHACRLKELTGFEEIFCCELIPFPGSPAFQWLDAKVHNDFDIFTVESLRGLWASHFCAVPAVYLNESVQRILQLGEYRITITSEERKRPIFPQPPCLIEST